MSLAEVNHQLIENLMNLRSIENPYPRLLRDSGLLGLAGGGIAKLAGVPSGPPPESGPNSQGLPGLLKRVRNL